MQSTPKNEIVSSPLTTQQLYETAQKNQVAVYPFMLSSCASLSIKTPDGKCSIALDYRLSPSAERTCLGHEIGHCMTGSFYDLQTPCRIREKCEYKANKWAILNLMPKRSVEEASRTGVTQPWQLAEHFGVTEDFARMALKFYKDTQEI